MSEKNYEELLEQVRKLEQEVEQLRKSGQEQEVPKKPAPKAPESKNLEPQKPEQKMAEPKKPVPQKPEPQRSEPKQTVQPSASPYGAPKETVPKTSKKEQDNMESKIGKQVMSIVASVLIFLSIVLFASMVYKYLTTWMKELIMYAVSLGFISFGLIKMKKESKYYSLFTALAGCGIGAFYLSGIISYYVFETISMPVLFALIAAWTLGVAYISKKKSKLFTYICYTGILISTILGAVEFGESPIGVVFYVVSLGILYGFTHGKEYRQDGWFFVQYPLVALVLSYYYTDRLWVLLLLIVTTVAVYIAQEYLYPEIPPNYIVMEYVGFYFTMIFLMYNKFCINVWSNLQNYEQWSSLSSWIILVAMGFLCIWTYRHFADRSKGFSLAALYASGLILPLFHYGDWYEEYVKYIPFIIVLYIAGIKCKNIHMRILACILSVFFLMNTPKGLNEVLVPVIFACSVLAYVLWCYASRRHAIVFEKYVALFMGLYLIKSITELLDYPYIYLTFMATAGMSLFVNSKHFRYTEKDEEQARIVGYIMNGAMMLIGCGSMFDIDDCLPIKIGVIIFTTLLFCANTTQLFEVIKNETLVGIYICVKMAVLICAILICFDAPGFVLSIVGIVFAIILITLGFYIRHKSFRISGLVVAIVCVAKLVVIDINYSSNIYRPIGLFVAGVLCFAISWIYSKLEKKSL